MKKILKIPIIFILAVFAQAVLRRYKPRIVMISGSVGKTSTKDAVAAALSMRFYVRKSEKSFNSEFGVPFTILGVGNPWNDPFAWFSIFKSALGLLILPNHYPTMLVLEIGADRPGDLARILRYATPDAVVITRLADIPVHVEAYVSPEQVHEEEFSPAYALEVSAPLIIPSDDVWVCAAAKRLPVRTFGYGRSTSGTIQISDTDFHIGVEGEVDGMQAKISMQDARTHYVVKDSVGETQMLPIAAAIATAHAFGIPLPETLTALEGYEAPAGRGRLLKGKNNSIIIDDSYNSSPAAVEEALSTLKSFPNAKRRIAVLGDMLELGRFSVPEHERMAIRVAESADMIVTVGIRARTFAIASKHIKLLQFDTAYAAAEALADLIEEKDVILVKGSQSIRTERIVEALLADPSDVLKLVRQEKKWKQKL
ncbi:hypothetical protein EXS57_00650 [Candidatus Kaiserbacteria bacterium]|nr:hypothetical protein [Candidatus Kaiserbacteria bacterium]